MTQATDPVATGLAQWAATLRLEQVPPAVLARAKDLMLDALGCGLAARGQDFAARYAAAVWAMPGRGEGGRGVIGFDQRLPLREAAMLNGVLCHGLDFDDTHMAGIAHLSVSVLPAMLGLGAEQSRSGAELLAAYVVGLECGARIASAFQGGLTAQGFHPSAVVGTFACAMAAGRLQGLDAPQLVAAQGIALSLASGSLEFLSEGAWTKRLHPGWAAQSGITAAHFAAHGIPAPTAPYTGRFGLFHSFLDEAQRRQLDAGIPLRHVERLDDPVHWELMHIAVKPYPMCHFVHAAVEAAEQVHRLGIAPADIARVRVDVPAGVVPSVCEPEAAKRRPSTDYEAKFSIPYAVASGLMRGRLGLKELEPEAYTAPEVRALMARVDYAVDPTADFPRYYGGAIAVELRNGETLHRRVPINPGHPERPLQSAQVARKFFDNAGVHFAPALAERVQTCVQSLETLPDVRALESLLAVAPG